MKKKLSLIGDIILYIIGGFVLLNIILLICGVGIYAVETGSMEPTIHQGSLIYVDKYQENEVFEKVEIYDDITYKTSSGKILTHRVVDIDLDKNELTTQGIREGAAKDAAISPSQVIGEVKLAIPVIGYIIILLKNIYVDIIIILIIILSIVVSSIIKETKKGKENPKAKA